MVKRARKKIYNLLRWSEKHTKTDMLYLAKGGGWLSLGQGTTMLIGFALSVGMGNFLPKEVFGNYKFVLSLAGILGAFTLTGMGAAITQSVARGFDGILKKGIQTHLKWDVFFAGASLLGATYYYINGNNVLALSLLVVGIFSPIFLSTALYSSFLNGKKDFKRNTLFNIVRNTISAGTILTTILLTENVVIIIFAYYLSITIPAIYFYRKTSRQYHLDKNKKVDKETILYSKHLSLMGILSGIATHVDKILIFHFLGAAQLAIYAFAVAIPEQLRQAPKIIATLALPKLSQRNLSELKETFLAKSLILLAAATVVTISYIVFAPYIYKTLFPQYIESVLFSQIFSLTILFLPAVLFNQALIAHARTKRLYFVNSLTPILRIILFLTLLPLFGVWGIILTHLIAGLVNTAILIYLLAKT